MFKKNALIFSLLLFIIALSSIFTVDQTKRSIVLRLGKITLSTDGEAKVFDPGLHFKVPVVDKVLPFDVRLQTLDVQSSRILTAEKKDVEVDSFIKWRITNFSLFFTRTTGDFVRAERLLRQKIVDSLRAEFGRRTVSEVVSGERYDIMNNIRNSVKSGVTELGIEVVDVRIKRINLPREVSEAVYARMRTERERIAREHRARGNEKAEKVQAEADRNVTVILATSNSDALKIRGEGDAVAAKIYADSYKKEAEFYNFYRALEAYKQGFDGKKDLFVINPNTQFFKYLKSPLTDKNQ